MHFKTKYYIIQDAIILFGGSKMNKISKILSLLLAAIMAFACFGICAFAVGENYLTLVDLGDSYIVNRCVTSATGEINIPATHNGKPVTAINSNAFKEAERISKVTIPASVTSVGSSAFENCASLGTVIFEGEECTIGTAAFRYCSTLKTIALPSKLKAIPLEAFAGCTALAQIDIPSTVTSINTEAFKGCTSLQSVTVPAGVTSIGKNAFLNCASVKYYKVNSGNTAYKAVSDCLYDFSGSTLIQYPNGKTATGFTVPAGTKTIADSAFGSNTRLTTVTLPSGLETISDYAFNQCTVLSKVTIPSTVKTLGSQAFGGCKNLKEITIPASVTSYSGAFYNSGIETVTIQNGVKIIDEKAFEKCASLKNVSIPSSVTEIKMGAFDGCEALETLTVPETVTTVGKNAFIRCGNLTLKVKNGSAAYNYAVANNIPYELTGGSTSQKTVTGMQIQKFPDKLDYNYRDTVSTAGMELLVSYSDGTTKTVTSGFDVSPSQLKKTGPQTVEVSYEGFTDYFTVNVSYTWWQMIIMILLLGFLWY